MKNWEIHSLIELLFSVGDRLSQWKIIEKAWPVFVTPTLCQNLEESLEIDHEYTLIAAVFNNV